MSYSKIFRSPIQGPRWGHGVTRDELQHLKLGQRCGLIFGFKDSRWDMPALRGPGLSRGARSAAGYGKGPATTLYPLLSRHATGRAIKPPGAKLNSPAISSSLRSKLLVGKSDTMRLTETNESISFLAEIGLAVGTLRSWCGSVGVAIGSGAIGVFSGSGFVRTR